MKKTLLMALFALITMKGWTISYPQPLVPANSCLQYDDRDGSSYEKAIIIEEATESEGVPAEYKWLRQHYPGYKFIRQSLRPYQGRYYDVLLIKYKGKKKEVYFDITNFFGKF